MGCESFENIVDFLKTTIPDMTQPQMEKIITQVRLFFFLLLFEFSILLKVCAQGIPTEYVEVFPGCPFWCEMQWIHFERESQSST